jgi:serine protease Do
MNRIIRKAAAPAALVLGLGVGVTALDALHDPIPQLDAQAPLPAVGGAESLASAFRTASRTALPGVVFVQVEAAPQSVSRQIPDQYRGTPFEDFFGSPQQPGAQRPRMGSGSGFIVSSDGYVLTNNHVVENASRVTVQLTDKREFEATVVGRDPNTDVAVLKIEGKDLPTVRLGNAEELQIGDWVLALGYPMSLGETVTAGIVSAKGKSIGIMQQNKEAAAPLEHFIQTDAAINPGNSGGPLVNLRGEVIGINTAIASPTGTYSGYGFAVPIQLAKRVADDLIRYGAVHRPKLGVQIKDVQPADVEVFGLTGAQGSVVAAVPEGPARDAGIQLGDVIVAVEGKPIKDTGELMERIALRQPGERVQLELVRYGDRKRMSVKLGAFEAAPAARAAGTAADRDAVSRLGFAATELTPALAQRMGLETSGGVVVTQVDPMGPAPRELTGLRLERINGKEIRSLDDLRSAAGSLRAGQTVSVIGRLGDGTETIVNYRLRG